MKHTSIDSYIEHAEPFAIPILKKMRAWVHKACPEVTESLKWGMPAFDYKGPLCSMASFKQHCVFAFWKEELISDPDQILQKRAMKGGTAMGHLGRIIKVSELPPDKVMIGFIRQVMKLNEEGVKVAKKKVLLSEIPEMPAEFKKALTKNKEASLNFKKFTPSAQKDYINWIAEAKTETTRMKRIDTSIEWISEGKRRNWKYEK